MQDVDFSTWIPGWTSLAFVLAYGLLLVRQAIRVRNARESFASRILVTGSRGKSGTVRLIHAALRYSGRTAYGKITGTTAVELIPDGTEVPTVRFGAAGISEMPQAMIRAARAKAEYGIFECMAISPDLIHLVDAKYVRPSIVVIPTIRLDHLEDEGLSELEIGMNIFEAVADCDYLVTGVDQPELLALYRQWCEAKGITLIEARPGDETPAVIGHHPTNVEIARQVLLLLGLTAGEAEAGLLTASTEPNALNFLSASTEHGITLGLADIGAANDPQSAAEALAQWPLDDDVVIPIVANRWDRPLRSVVFAGALLGRFPVIGISGTVFRWVRNLTPGRLSDERRPYGRTQVFKLSRSQAGDPERLARTLTRLLGEPGTGRFVLVLMGNTHDAQTARLRDTLAQRGVRLEMTYQDPVD